MTKIAPTHLLTRLRPTMTAAARISLTCSEADKKRLDEMAAQYRPLSEPENSRPKTAPGIAARGIVLLALDQAEEGNSWVEEAITAAAQTLRAVKRGDAEAEPMSGKIGVSITPDEAMELRLLAAQHGTTVGVAGRGILIRALDEVDQESALGKLVEIAVETEIEADRDRRRRVASRDGDKLRAARQRAIDRKKRKR